MSSWFGFAADNRLNLDNEKPQNQCKEVNKSDQICIEKCAEVISQFID